ncbi:hypothetical protein V493_03641 [Pseudogymnoascus sp. VKM F-4281 (FW-2241)]|nr:hypothetical protein V493_03641 [Pseudogymnoascus sp. VKM F-4281 (FW-2241)]
MFSRILSSARNIVPFNKHDQAAENEKKSPGGRSLTKHTADKKSITPKSTMVTTRRQSGASATLINPDDSSVPDELLSASAKKRRRTELSRKAATEADAGTPTKRRRLPVRTKDENSPDVTQSHLAVEIPVRELSEEPTASTPSAKSNKGTPKSTPKGKRNTGVVDTESTGETASTTEQKEPAGKEIISKDSTKAEVGHSQNNGSLTAVDAPVAKPKHKKFGDNDPVEAVAAPEPEAERIQEEDEDESSDDDAPEEVGAEAAQSKAKGAAREAAKAAEQKEAAERQKRKDRDAQLKAQAKAAKKRKHADEELDESATIENSSITIEPAGRASTKPRFDRTTLPDLLPEEFLEDAVSEDEAPVQVEKPRVSKKIKFAYEEKKPKDKKLGSTTYRVAQVEKEGFAPKVSHNTVSSKASLQGRRKGQNFDIHLPPRPQQRLSSKMITEIATFKLTSPADFSDAESPTASTIRTFLAAVLATEGAHAAYFGQVAESPDTVIIFIDWDSTEAHNQFLASPAHDHMASPVLEIMNLSLPPRVLHVPPIPHVLLGEQADINVTEVLFFYFPASITAEDIDDFAARIEKLRPALEDSEAKGVFQGWAEEGDVEYVDSEGVKGECKVWVSVVGWEDLEAHLRVAESEEFKVNKELLVGMEVLRGIEMFHTTLVKV